MGGHTTAAKRSYFQTKPTVGTMHHGQIRMSRLDQVAFTSDRVKLNSDDLVLPQKLNTPRPISANRNVHVSQMLLEPSTINNSKSPVFEAGSQSLAKQNHHIKDFQTLRYDNRIHINNEKLIEQPYHIKHHPVHTNVAADAF